MLENIKDIGEDIQEELEEKINWFQEDIKNFIKNLLFI